MNTILKVTNVYSDLRNPPNLETGNNFVSYYEDENRDQFIVTHNWETGEGFLWCGNLGWKKFSLEEGEVSLTEPTWKWLQSCLETIDARATILGLTQGNKNSIEEQVERFHNCIKNTISLAICSYGITDIFNECPICGEDQECECEERRQILTTFMFSLVGVMEVHAQKLKQMAAVNIWTKDGLMQSFADNLQEIENRKEHNDKRNSPSN